MQIVFTELRDTWSAAAGHAWVEWVFRHFTANV